MKMIFFKYAIKIFSNYVRFYFLSTSLQIWKLLHSQLKIPLQKCEIFAWCKILTFCLVPGSGWLCFQKYPKLLWSCCLKEYVFENLVISQFCSWSYEYFRKRLINHCLLWAHYILYAQLSKTLLKIMYIPSRFFYVFSPFLWF